MNSAGFRAVCSSMLVRSEPVPMFSRIFYTRTITRITVPSRGNGKKRKEPSRSDDNRSVVSLNYDFRQNKFGFFFSTKNPKKKKQCKTCRTRGNLKIRVRTRWLWSWIASAAAFRPSVIDVGAVPVRSVFRDRNTSTRRHSVEIVQSLMFYF